MKLGIDIGSSDIKVNTGLVIPSKIKEGKYINKAIELVHERRTWTVGDGIRDVEINKVDRSTNLLFLYASIGLASEEIENEIAIGLPIGQYQKEKDRYREFIMDNHYADIELNGERKVINITNCKIYAEGLSAVDSNYNGIILDIGGRTTDIAILDNRKVVNPISKPKGTLNLYSNIVNSINTKYGLDLIEEDAERIIKNGLKIDGEHQNLDFMYNILTVFTEDIINTLKLEYSLRTNDLLIIGGGGNLFYKSIKKRVKQAQLIENSIFANAEGFRRSLK